MPSNDFYNDPQIRDNSLKNVFNQSYIQVSGKINSFLKEDPFTTTHIPEYFIVLRYLIVLLNME